MNYGNNNNNNNVSPTAPAQGYNVFVKNELTVKANEKKGAVTVGKNLNIKGDYRIGSDTCGEFTTSGSSTTTKIGLLVNGRVNYPLNTVVDTTDEDCDCGDPTLINNGSFEGNTTVTSWKHFN
jgi:choice-of-anchor A domain-containing protein